MLARTFHLGISIMFVFDSATSGYLKMYAFNYLLLLYLGISTEILITLLFIHKKIQTTQKPVLPMYYRNSKGYTCTQHNLYDMGYIEATAHFGLQHDMTLDEVEDE